MSLGVYIYTFIYVYICIHVSIYIYRCACKCMCMCEPRKQPLARRGRHLIEFADLLFLTKALKNDIRVVVVSLDVALDVPLFSLHRSGFDNCREVLGLTTAARCLAERRKKFEPAVRLHVFVGGKHACGELTL